MFHVLNVCTSLGMQGGFWNRGYLQPHPNGSAMFVHRVGTAKFELGSDDPKPITHVTVPSCNYFGEKVGCQMCSDASLNGQCRPQVTLATQRAHTLHRQHAAHLIACLAQQTGLGDLQVSCLAVKTWSCPFCCPGLHRGAHPKGALPGQRVQGGQPRGLPLLDAHPV